MMGASLPRRRWSRRHVRDASATPVFCLVDLRLACELKVSVGPCVLTVSGQQILVDPLGLKMMKLPPEGKKGGCNDWTVTAQTAEGGVQRFILESSSKAVAVKARYVDNVLGSSKATEADEECLTALLA